METFEGNISRDHNKKEKYFKGRCHREGGTKQNFCSFYVQCNESKKRYLVIQMVLHLSTLMLLHKPFIGKKLLILHIIKYFEY
jgi:hypothetical protein